LGPLEPFYHDCVGSRGTDQKYVRKTLRLALSGNESALQAVFTDKDHFGTGDNEAYSELPYILLQEIGDSRYSDFVKGQPASVQDAALCCLSPSFIPSFDSKYPKTSKLFYAHYPKQK